MEFFDWAALPQLFITYFDSFLDLSVTTLEEYAALMRSIQTIGLCVAAGLTALCLVLGGFGLRTMALRVGMKHTWMAFCPFLNTYYAGKLAGETRLFNQKMKRAGLYAMIAEIVYVALNVFGVVLFYLFMNPAYYRQEFLENGNWMPVLDESRVPIGMRWMSTADLVITILTMVSYIALIFFMCVLFVAFFRKYYARSPILMTFLSAVLPLRGFVIFAVRKNTPVDYDAWMRRRMEAYARHQQEMYGQGGYGGQGGYDQNGYGQGGYGGPQNAPHEDPFPDYGSGGTDHAAPAGDASVGAPTEGGNGPQGDDDPFPDF